MISSDPVRSYRAKSVALCAVPDLCQCTTGLYSRVGMGILPQLGSTASGLVQHARMHETQAAQVNLAHAFQNS
jgi:hypothetical protein